MGPAEKAAAPVEAEEVKDVEKPEGKIDADVQVSAQEDQGAPRGMVKSLLFRSQQADDESVMGLRAAADAQSIVPDAKPNAEAILAVMMSLPKHMALEVGYSFLPMIMGCIPVLVCGFLTREFRRVIPEHVGTIKELELRAAEMTVPEGWLGCNAAMIFVTVVFLMFLFVPRAIWKCATRYWLRIFVPWYALNMAFFLLRPVLQSSTGKADTIDKVIFLLNAGSTGVAIVLQFFFIGRATKNPALHKHISVAVVTVILLFYVNRNYMHRVLGFDNVGKLIYVGVVNPILMQVFVILVLRLTARAFHHNDPSTSWVIMALGIIWEKAYSRIVIASIHDLFVAAVAGAASSAGSGLVLLIVGFEDRRVYSLLARCCGLERSHANINNERNAGFRTSVHVLDFTVELAMIVAFSTLMFAYQVQMADGKLQEGGWVLASVVVQICTQIGTYAVQITYVTVFMGIDFMGLARKRCRYWSLVAGVACMWPTSLMCGSMVVQLFCAAPEGSAGLWQLCA